MIATLRTETVDVSVIYSKNMLEEKNMLAYNMLELHTQIFPEINKSKTKINFF